jgi:stress response protein YsnF
VILHEEEPVVEKRTVPKERVRLGAETHVDERQIAEEIRKEHIEIDDSQQQSR